MRRYRPHVDDYGAAGTEVGALEAELDHAELPRAREIRDRIRQIGQDVRAQSGTIYSEALRVAERRVKELEGVHNQLWLDTLNPRRT